MIWWILSAAAGVALLARWGSRNAVWGTATFGALFGLLIAVFRSGFDWGIVGKAFVIGTLVGLTFEWLGRIGTKLARRTLQQRGDDIGHALRSVYDETLRQAVRGELDAECPEERMTGPVPRLLQRISKNRGKILALIGVGLYVPWVISSAEDANGNSLASDALILLSGSAIVIYVVIAAAVLWKIEHRGVALALPITFMATGIAVFFLTPNPSTLNIVLNATKVMWFVTYFYAVWLMFLSDRKRIVAG